METVGSLGSEDHGVNPRLGKGTNVDVGAIADFNHILNLFGGMSL